MITAQVVLINSEGLILGVSRKDNHYDMGLIGGKMEPRDKEDPKNTAIREALEETGLYISDLRLVLAIHKDGNMSYTYLAKYAGEINHNEPHLVEWVPMERLVLGSFGKYNKLVSESLRDMGITFIYSIPLDEIKIEVEQYINSTKFNELNLRFSGLYKEKNWLGVEQLTVYMLHENGLRIDEELDFDDNFSTGLENIGKKHGIYISIPSDYYSK